MAEEENIIRSGVPSESQDFTCGGCGQVHTVKRPKRKAGAHVALIIVDENDQASEPVYTYLDNASAGAKWLKTAFPGGQRCARGGASDAPDAEDPDSEGEAVPASLMGRKRKGPEVIAVPSEPAPVSEREPEAVSN